MSEYQYYEFVAIDEPLTAAQMEKLRARSSRAVITPTSFVNEYHWGNLKGDPIDWMRRYFDAHVYVANWCSCWLFLRVPKDVFAKKTLNAFETQYAFTVDRTDNHWILEWELSEGQDDDRFGAEDGRGWMGRLASLRDELLRGDLRPLYLGWLAGVSAGEIDDEAIEPPPPPGLSRLTTAQRSLVEFLEIDQDLLAAAAFSDTPQSDGDIGADACMDAWIAALPDNEGRAVIKLLLMGRAQQAERQLKSRFLAWQRQQRPAIETSPMRRTVAVLRALSKSAARTRTRQEAVQRRKAEAKQQATREAYLRTLADDVDRYWKAAHARAERGIASAYDDVQHALVDLADAYALCASRAEFDRRLSQFMVKHSKRGALLRRLVESGLWKK
jgi:hypothetical protein